MNTGGGTQPGQTSGNFGESEYGQRLVYTESHWRDPIWAVLWIIHMLIMAYALYAIWGDTSDMNTSEANDIFLVLFVLSVIGAVFGVIWMQVLRQCGGAVIKFMLIAYLVMLCLGCAAMFLSGQLFGGIIFLIFVVIFGLYVRAIWDRIPFTACLIDIAGSIMQAYQGTIWVSLLCLVLQIVWVLWWSAIASGYFSTNDTSNVVVFLMLVSFYWSLQVFQNISHMTTCGVAGAWYFSTGENLGLTGSALKRTLTTSFGSVCFGSFLVAIIQAMRAMVRAARSSGQGGAAGQILLCLADCLLRCLDRLVQWFNKYAYVQCAVYGVAFKEAAKRTWDLLMARGIDAWVNDDLTGFAVACGALIGGVICAVVGYFMASNTDTLDGGSIPIVVALIGFIVGFFLVHTVLYTIESGVATLFVCYGEDPGAMSRNRPEEYNALISVAPPLAPIN